MHIIQYGECTIRDEYRVLRGRRKWVKILRGSDAWERKGGEKRKSISSKKKNISKGKIMKQNAVCVCVCVVCYCWNIKCMCITVMAIRQPGRG